MTRSTAAWADFDLSGEGRIRQSLVPGLLILSDVMAFVLALLLAEILMELGALDMRGQVLSAAIANPSALLEWPAFVVLGWLVVHFATRGHYTARVPFWNEVGTVISAAAIGFAADTFLDVLASPHRLDTADLAGWVLLVPTLLAGRQAVRMILNRFGCWRLRTVIIGDPADVASAEAALRSEPALGYEVVGNVAMADVGDPEPIGSWLDVVRGYGAGFVVVALGGGRVDQERIVTTTLMRQRLRFAIMPVFSGLPVTGFNQNYFFSHDVLLLAAPRSASRPLGRIAKIVLDKAGAALLLLLLLPLFVVIASIVRADRGPAFFAHRRIGANGQAFRCLKFRTMVMDSDRVLRQLLESDPAARAEWEETQKLRNDPRVTPIGVFLRKTSLDEFPQLINVLRGEMSLVGPRPIVEAEVVRYGRDIDHYYEARPGMTGLWQVSGRSDTSYQRRVQLDTWYVKNWSLWHDIAILLKTIPAVISKDGAV
jgi:Undecaprenyl-phosphate galactose phosphotransferase WbaP